ncbi:MAG: type V CRISPR-associated endonuclease Cas1 [Bacteroidales bacterium]|nr:type V CRISPR-associated endonuclease Cas1 [Bacteroidales bacterium]
MFTNKDLEYKSIFVVNCEEQRALRVSNGELLLEEVHEEGKRTLTKMPFQKMLALFVIGHITITTPLIEKCKKNNVALCVMKHNLRPVFFEGESAEANFLLRKRQYALDKEDVNVAKALMRCKFKNQCKLLKNTRKKDALTLDAIAWCEEALNRLPFEKRCESLMGLEGCVARSFFAAYYQDLKWKQRLPRLKCDAINAALDIGYTLLFNFVEVYARMFGFDLYMGVYHRLWFKRKSLVCDLIEPFRCIIDQQMRKAWNLGQVREEDFDVTKGEYRLKFEKNGDYCKLFYTALADHKKDIFVFMQGYYRHFMRSSEWTKYPIFEI